MRRPSRVVIIQNQLAELGGITQFCKVVGEGLLGRGHTVEIGAIEPPHAGPALEYDSRIDQWTLHDVSVLDHRGRTESFWNDVTTQACRRFTEYDPDTIVLFTQLYARERTRGAWEGSHHRNGFRSIVQYHDAFHIARRGRDLGRARRAYADADLFLLLTEADARAFQQAGFNNTSFVYNPIDARELPMSDVAAPVVVSLGRYDPQKSLDQMIHAWALLASDFPEWRLDLYGEGPLRADLENLIQQLELRSSVHLRGRSDDVVGVLAEASVNAISSRHEGLPFALMEASAIGVPNVSYDCAPGVGVIIDDGVTGLITARNDPAALADSLSALMADQALRQQMGRAGRERMKQIFSIETILDQWEQVFDDVLR